MGTYHRENRLSPFRFILFTVKNLTKNDIALF